MAPCERKMRSILATHDLDTLFRRKDVQGVEAGRERQGGRGKGPTKPHESILCPI